MGKTVHVEVTLEECRGDFNKMLRKYLKKLHKSKVIQEHKEKSFYVKPSVREYMKKHPYR